MTIVRTGGEIAPGAARQRLAEHMLIERLPPPPLNLSPELADEGLSRVRKALMD